MDSLFELFNRNVYFELFLGEIKRPLQVEHKQAIFCESAMLHVNVSEYSPSISSLQLDHMDKQESSAYIYTSLIGGR